MSDKRDQTITSRSNFKKSMESKGIEEIQAFLDLTGILDRAD